MNTDSKAYQDCEKMLAGMAWESARRNGLRFDDCLSECHVAFMEAQARFDPSRGTQLPTLVHAHAWNRLRHFAWVARRNSARMPVMDHTESEPEHFEPVQPVAGQNQALEVVETLSGEARELVTLLIESPGEILDEAVRTPKELLGAVRRYLLGRGWTRDDFYLTLAEIRTHLRREWARD